MRKRFTDLIYLNFPFLPSVIHTHVFSHVNVLDHVMRNARDTFYFYRCFDKYIIFRNPYFMDLYILSFTCQKSGLRYVRFCRQCNDSFGIYMVLYHSDMIYANFHVPDPRIRFCPGSGFAPMDFQHFTLLNISYTYVRTSVRP